MAFREDRDAIAHRADAAERDLVDARQKLQSETLRAAEVDDLRKRLDELSAERDALRRGVEPIWRSRVILGAVVALAALTAAGFFLWQLRRASARDQMEIERLSAALDAAEPRVSAALEARDRALAEVELANQSAADETQTLERQLTTARTHETGEVFLVTANVTATAGLAPTAPGGLCALTIRRSHGECLASVVCDGRPVFPIIEPIPPVVCTDEHGRPWSGGVPAHASVAVTGHPPLLLYDLNRGTIIVRETAGPWSATLHIRDSMPMFVR